MNGEGFKTQFAQGICDAVSCQRTCNVFEIPTCNVVHAVNGSKCNMCRIQIRSLWHGAALNQLLGQLQTQLDARLLRANVTAATLGRAVMYEITDVST